MTHHEPRAEKAFAAAHHGKKSTYISPNSVRIGAGAARQQMGKSYARDGETWQEGWERARKRGWRIIRVTISAGW